MKDMDVPTPAVAAGLAKPSPDSRVRGLYRGPGGMRNLTGILQSLVREGRDVAVGQRERWMENRAFYRGDQWLEYHPITGQLRVAASGVRQKGGRPRDTVNRLRQFVDARLAMYAVERPPFEVMPENQSQEAIDGAHQAERLLDAQWGSNGWNVKAKAHELALAGEIDGIAFLCVEWDPSKGPETNIPFVVTPDGPVVDPEMIGALKQMDPEGRVLWKPVIPEGPIGDVVFRVVRAGAMSVDPMAGPNFDDAYWCCESRVISRAQAEKIAGRPWVDILRESDGVLGISDRDYNALGGGTAGVDTDSGDVVNQYRGRDAVTVNLFYHRPGGDFPKGLRCIWFDQAPGAPVVTTEWNDDLPYRPFTPRPDGGNLFACRGTVDDLKPVQRRFNRILSMIHEWLDRVGRTPIGIYKGMLASDSIYNDRGYYELNPGFGEPSYMQVPSEPVAVLTHHLNFCIQQMQEIAAITDAARGEAMGSREAASSIQLRIQQTEQQLSGATAQLINIYEWACTRALKLVGSNYILPRAVVSPGVSDSLEFAGFVGSMLGGAHRFKVTGSIQPATRAAELQGLMQFAPILGESIRPYVSSLISGDTSEFKKADEAQRKRQQRKNRMLARLASNQEALTVWENFNEDKEKHAAAMQLAAEVAQQSPPMQATGPDGAPVQTPPPPSPQSILQGRGITPPRLLDALAWANIEVPTVEPQDDPIQQLEVLRQWMVSQEFERMHPIVHQGARELQDALTRKMAEQLTAMGMQDPNAVPPGESGGGAPPGQPSPPAPKGQPSPPKQGGGPSSPVARVPTGG